MGYKYRAEANSMECVIVNVVSLVIAYGRLAPITLGYISDAMPKKEEPASTEPRREPPGRRTGAGIADPAGHKTGG